MSGYLRPVDAPISSSWADHRRRTPPSTEPGTDYACAVGTAVRSPAAGVVIAVDRSAAGAEGRRVAVRLDDGNVWSGIHLRSIHVETGQRVARGQHVADSGGSAFGRENGRDPHLHSSLWIRPARWPIFGVNSTADFEQYVGTQPAAAGAIREEEDMRDDERTALFTIRDELRELLPGKAGVRHQGAVNRQWIEILTSTRTLAERVGELWNRLLPGTAGVKTQGDLNRYFNEILTNTRAMTERLDKLEGEIAELKKGTQQ